MVSYMFSYLTVDTEPNQDNNFNNIIPEVTLYIISNKKLIGASIEDDN